MAVILVAEDNEMLSDLLREFLGTRGHRVIPVLHGNEIVPKVQEFQPRLIILDVMMPGTYGTAAYKELETLGVTKTVPVIFMSAIHPSKVAQAVPPGPLTRFLPKPVDLPKLDSLLTELLGPASA